MWIKLIPNLDTFSAESCLWLGSASVSALATYTGESAKNTLAYPSILASATNRLKNVRHKYKLENNACCTGNPRHDLKRGTEIIFDSFGFSHCPLCDAKVEYTW